MALIALGRAFRPVRILMAVYADLVGEVLAEAFDLAGLLFVAYLAIAPDFIDVIKMIKNHFAVF